MSPRIFHIETQFATSNKTGYTGKKIDFESRAEIHQFAGITKGKDRWRVEKFGVNIHGHTDNDRKI